jgi:hypothetical protein
MGLLPELLYSRRFHSHSRLSLPRGAGGLHNDRHNIISHNTASRPGGGLRHPPLQISPSCGGRTSRACASPAAQGAAQLLQGP